MTKSASFNRVLSLVLTVLMIVSMMSVFTLTVVAEGTAVYKIKFVDSENHPAFVGALVRIYDFDAAERDQKVGDDGIATYTVTTEKEKVTIGQIYRNGNVVAEDKVLVDGYTIPVTLKNNDTVEVVVPTKASVATLTGAPSDWTNQDVVLTATCEGAWRYKWNDATTLTDSNTFTATQNGTYSVVAVDGFGNESDKVTVEVNKIDKTAPVITEIKVDPTEWTNQAVEVTVEAKDDESGVAQYKMDGGAWQNSNVFSVADNTEHTFYVKDVAGTESEVTDTNICKATVKYETDLPVINKITAVVTDGEGEKDVTTGSANWTNQPVTFRVDATDGENGSGIAQYKMDNGQWQVSNEFTGITNPDGHKFFVKDKAGNETTVAKWQSAQYDAKAPEITVAVTDVNGTDVAKSTANWTNQPVKFTVSATDLGAAGIASYRIDNGEWVESPVFENISDNKVHKFDVIDKAGNEASFELSANFDGDKPVISSVTALDENGNDVTTGSENYTNKPFKFVVSATDVGGSGLYQYKMDDGQWQTSNEFTGITDPDGHRFYVRDTALNETKAKWQSAQYDKKAPVLENVKFEQVNDGTFAETLNKLTFGAFFNKSVKITVTADDYKGTEKASYPASGVVAYKLHFYTNGDYTQPAVKVLDSTDGVFTVDQAFAEDFKGTIKAESVDSVGNSTGEVLVVSSESTVENTVKSDIKDLPGDLFMIEDTAPVITINTEDVINKGEFNVEFKVTDGGNVVSGVNTVKVTVNGKDVYTDDDLLKVEEPVATKDYTVTVDSVEKTIAVNGGNAVKVDDVWPTELTDKLTVVIDAVDNAGNVATTVSRDVQVDNTPAKITGFKFTTLEDDDITDASNIDGEPYVNEEVFGFFFNQNVKVVISASDTQESGDTAVAGVKSITYALVHVDGTVITETVDVTDDKITVSVPALFKGQIYAYATDKVGNAPTVYADTYKGYVHPYGTITETQNEHENEKEPDSDTIIDHVKLELPETTFKTAGDGLLYAENVPVKVTITDRQSSISKVEWKISTPAGVVSSGSVDVNNATTDSTADTNDDTSVIGSWATVERDPALNPMGSKLVTQLSNTITVSKDLNCDGIVVYVKMTDRAGNVTEDTVTFGIDSEAPAVPTYGCDDGWYNTAIDYTVASSDNWSGIMAYGKSYKGGQTEWTAAADAAEFVYPIADQYLHTFYVKDRAGNVSQITMTEPAKYDITDPAITHVAPTLDKAAELNSDSWTNDTVYFVVTANDDAVDNTIVEEGAAYNNSGIAYFCMLDHGTTVANMNWQPVDAYEFDVNDFKKHDFYVMDHAGNVSKVAYSEDAEMFDAKDADLVDVVFGQENSTVLAKAINFLTFGTFFNEKVTVTVNTQDVADEINGASGVRQIDLILKDEEGNEVKTYPNMCNLGEELDNTFEIPQKDVDNFKGTVYVKIYDHATSTDGESNVTDEIFVTTENSNVGFTEFMIENDPAEISDVAPENESIHNDEFVFNFNVSDIIDVDKHYSGINGVEVKVNGTVAMLNDLSDETVAVSGKPYAFTIDTNAKTITNEVNYNGGKVDLKNSWNSGVLDIDITVVDNSGNVTTASRKYFVDNNSPVIDGFEFSLDKNIDVTVNDNELYKSITIDPVYGFYFKEEVTVTVTASDSVYTVENDAANSETKASGVDTITYAYDGFDFAGNPVTKTETIAAVDNKISFVIPTGFKGQIYAYATDKLGNNPGNSTTFTETAEKATFGDINYWVRPSGQVIETQAQHDSQLGHITFAVPETAYTQNNNIPLYNKDVPVTVTVKDLYSGIAKVEWSVEGEHDAANNQSGVVNIDNALNLDDASWTVVKTEENLVTEIQKTIVVNNNCNDIKVNVKITDRAGNVSETVADGTYKTLVFGIDKTIPTIDITYDNNTPDAQYTDIYNADRTATVVITERNFRAKDVVFKITSTDGTIPAIDLTSEGAWKTVAGETPDKTQHVATFTYSADGDYTFDISYKDNAENAAPAVPQHKFTVDKTLPVIASVVYDNNDSRNGNYFKADRVATITIVEHNFDPARVVNLGVATDDGNPVTFPQISAWTTVGDTHTATVYYSADALYTFDIDFKDMAGNNIADYVPHDFYVDKTLPSLVIDGVAADSANKDEGNIGFTITASDTNLDLERFSPVVKAMVLDPKTGAFVEKTINLGGAATGHNTATYRVTNLAEDGVYSITCTLIDKAGNSFNTVVLRDANGGTFNERVTADKPLILFSVNRNGSTFYVDDDYTKGLALEGGQYYTQNVEKDLLIKEFNPDSIQASDVKITVNGQQLKEGEDYERTTSQNGGYTYLYTISKDNFKAEGEYNIVISTKDRATNEAFSDMKFGAIKFVVDRTAPVVTVTGLKTNGRYQVEKQKVTLTPTDDGGLITKLSVVLTEKDGTVIDEIIVLEGEELADALAKGFVEFDIGAKNSAQYVKIICEDKAGNKIGVDGEGEVFSNVTITTNAFLIFWANPVARYSAIAAVVVLAAAIIFFVILKKKKKETEADK